MELTHLTRKTSCLNMSKLNKHIKTEFFFLIFLFLKYLFEDSIFFRSGKRMRITNGCNLSGADYNHPADISINKCLEDLIEDNEDIKDTVALVNSETGKEVTYRELNAKANKVARALLNNIKSNNTNPNSDGDYIVALR